MDFKMKDSSKDTSEETKINEACTNVDHLNIGTECKICMEHFDVEQRRPRFLPCGHTFCSPCFEELTAKAKDTIPCPVCRKDQTVPEDGRFPVNYALEDVMMKQNDTKLAQPGAEKQADEGLCKKQKEEKCKPNLDSNRTMQETLKAPAVPSSTPGLKVQDFWSRTQLAMDMVKAGLIFITHEDKGRCRTSRVSLVNGRLYLHSLSNTAPPNSVITLQMSELVPPSPPWTVFLDLSWPGHKPERVHIRMNFDSPRGRQFILLCTGQRGPSYVNTKLWDVWSHGGGGEWVAGGDYERNDGTGGQALLPDIHKGDYDTSSQAGVVGGRWVADPALDAQFFISTRNRCSMVGVFGEVEVPDLQVVAAAARYRPINKVTVVDCGVVF